MVRKDILFVVMGLAEGFLFRGGGGVSRREVIRMGGEGEIKAWFKENGYGEVKKAGGSYGGSGWSATAKWANDEMAFFVKTSSTSAEKMFKGEAAGLRALRAAAEAGGGSESERLRIPQVFACQDYADKRGSFIIMEFLNLSRGSDPTNFGRAMARLHLAEGGQTQFGFELDNTIGATPQPNTWLSDWPEFYAEKRLKHQANLANDPAISRSVDLCCHRILDFFADSYDDDQRRLMIKPSMLHGDLWSGNIGSVDNGAAPTIFDPACYYGHHEAEWGMSWCASFGPQFWNGYRQLIPEAPLFRARRPLYEAYHQINHYNLFGSGYRNAALSCLDQALKALP